MGADRLLLGVFTTDEHLVVRTWDDWMSRAAGIEPPQALNRPLLEVLPDVRTRGFSGVLQNVLTRGTVEVLAPALHHYLFACAPTEPSTRFDRMQQHVTIGPLRDDGRIVGLIVTVEDVTARMDDERQVAAELSRLGDQDWRVRRKAIATLAQQQGPAVVAALVHTLRQQHSDLNVLSSALDLLALSDIDIIDPLIQCLDDEDVNLRTQAALILGNRRDRRAIPALLSHLPDPDVNVTFHVIEALGRLHATESCDRLVAIAEQRDFFLAFPALQALRRVGTAAVAPRLVPLLADELLRAPVIEALGELGEEDVTLPLVKLLDSATAPTEIIADALAGLHARYESRYGAGEHIASLVRRHVSATGTQRILDAVPRAAAEGLSALATVLGWLDGEAVQRTLTRLLGHDKVRSQVIEALVRNGRGVVLLLIEQLRAEDLETRQAAAVALGRIGDRRATAALVAALQDRELAEVAAGALARIGDPEAFEALIGLIGDPDAAIRQAVVAALNSIGHPDMPRRIVPLLDDPDPTVRESAVRIAGYFGYAVCLERVLACCGDAAESVRRAAVEQLATFDDASRTFPVLQQALDDEMPPVRAAAAATLGRIDHPCRDEALMSALEDDDSWVRYVTLKSLAAIGPAGALAAVVDRLHHDSAPLVRLAAVEVVGRLTPPEALPILEPLTRSSNEDIARAAIGALRHVNQPEALAVLEQEARAPARWRRLAAIDAMVGRRETRLSSVLQWVAAADADVEVVQAAVAALAKIGGRDDRQGSEATCALISLALEPSRRQAAILALSSLPPRRINDIASGLRHASPVVRCAVVEALGRMKRPEASQAVEAALDDAVAPVRLTAVAELKHLGARASQRKLMQVARTDPDAGVRRAAMMAVARADRPGGLDAVEPQ